MKKVKSPRMWKLLHEYRHFMAKRKHKKLTRQPEVWNYATDCAINALLLNGGLRLPNFVMPEEFQNMTAEEIYDYISMQRKIQRACSPRLTEDDDDAT